MSGQEGGRGRGREKVRRKKGRGTLAGGCCCAGALGRALGGGAGSRAGSPAGEEREARVDAKPLYRGVRLSSLTLHPGGAGSDPKPRPHPVRQWPAALENCGSKTIPIGNLQSNRKRRVSRLARALELGVPKAETLGRGFRCSQLAHSICEGRRGRGACSLVRWEPGTGPGSWFTRKRGVWARRTRGSLRLTFADVGRTPWVPSWHH